jgi:hypothetical protein
MTIQNPSRVADRRGTHRPRNGDTKPCAHCGATVEFSERYRFEGDVVPAWVCESPKCRARELVRCMFGSSSASGLPGVLPAEKPQATTVALRRKKPMAKAALRPPRPGSAP